VRVSTDVTGDLYFLVPTHLLIRKCVVDVENNRFVNEFRILRFLWISGFEGRPEHLIKLIFNLHNFVLLVQTNLSREDLLVVFIYSLLPLLNCLEEPALNKIIKAFTGIFSQYRELLACIDILDSY
jgi:hypothetical protein